MPVRTRIVPAVLAAVLVGASAVIPAAAVAADPDDEVRLFGVDVADLPLVDDLDVLTVQDGRVVVLGDEDTEALLEDRGVGVLDVERYGDAIGAGASARAVPFAAAGYPVPERLAGTEYETFFGGYRTVAAYERFAADLSTGYPELVELVDFGDSWLKTQTRGGHDLLAVRITADVAAQPDPDDGQEGRPRFVLAAQAHAREIITSELAWRYATELVDGYGVDPQITSLLDSTEVWINFQNNPDGIDLVEQALATAPVNASGDASPPSTSRAWQRKNVNDTLFSPTSANWSSQQPGVDLNRNWAFHWGGASTSAVPTNTTYKGTAPHSEPEVAATSALLTRLFGEYPAENTLTAPADRAGSYVNLHSYANYVIYPYAYDKAANVPNLEPIKANAFRQSFANGFATGKAGEILYDNAGNDIDWIYSQLGVPAYTYEIGTAQTGGFFPAFSRVDGFWDRVAPGIRFAAEAAYEPYTAGLGAVTSEVTAVRAVDGSVTVTGTATDEAYGADPGSAARRPAVTDVVAVEAALATGRAGIDTTVPLALDASGTTVTFTGTIAGDRGTAAATAVFVRAKNGSGQWGPWRAASTEAIAAPAYTGPPSFRIPAGQSQRLRLEVDSAVPPLVTILEGELPAGLALDEATGTITGTANRAERRELTVRFDNGAGTVDAALAVEVTPAALSAFALDLSEPKPKQGSTITITATGVDEFGNEIADYSDRVTVTSDVATDVVDGNRVTFPTASPHTLTVTFEGVSSTILVHVTPVGGAVVPEPGSGGGAAADPAGLASTGVQLGGLIAAAVAALLAGAVLLRRRRRRTA